MEEVTVLSNHIEENIKILRADIAEAAMACGRSPQDIRLVAAAKTNTAGDVAKAITAGVDAVGENRVQEMLSKNAEGAYAGAPLHFIGHLQTNKVSKVVGLCNLIESVGSVKLIEMIGQKAASKGLSQDILIEVNIGEEPQKSGILPRQLDETLHFASETAGVNVLGIMSIPPIFDEISEDYKFFEAMYNLFIDMSAKKYDNVSMRFLSMGMSDSYREAISAGSNMVRIGSAIFGKRRLI